MATHLVTLHLKVFSTSSNMSSFIRTGDFSSLTSELINIETFWTLQYQVPWIRPGTNDNYGLICWLFFRLTDNFFSQSQNIDSSNNTFPFKVISSTCLLFLDQQTKSLRISICNNIKQKNNKSTNLKKFLALLLDK